MLDRTIAPASGNIVRPDLKPCEHFVLSNGVPIYYLPKGAKGVVKFEILFHSGVWHETMPGVSWFVSNMLREGTHSKSAQQIAEIFEYHGAFIEINPGFDHVSIAVFCMTEGYGEIIQLLFDLLTSAAFPTLELDTLKNNRAQQINVNLAKNSFVASREIRRLLFGEGHPYGRSLQPDQIPAIEKDHLVAFYESDFINTPKIYLSGDVDDTMLKKASDVYAKLEIAHKKETQKSYISTTFPEGFIEKEGSLQSSIRLGVEIPNKSHKDYYNILITNEILGGYFSSRLMKNLREDKGYTYGVHSRPLHLLKKSFLVVSTDVMAQSTKSALIEIEKEIDILQQESITDQELDVVRNYMAGSFLSSISTPFELMEKFKAVHQFGLDYSYYDGLFNCLQTITPQHIQQTAQRYFSYADMSKAVVGLID